jgi:hypothetical protein
MTSEKFESIMSILETAPAPSVDAPPPAAPKKKATSRKKAKK